LKIKGVDAAAVKTMAEKYHTNFRYFEDGTVGISLDETTSVEDANTIIRIFEALTEKNAGHQLSAKQLQTPDSRLQTELQRTSTFLTHPVFNTHHSESQMMRYLKQLENKDLS
jgi:glycine dehydrogenase